MLTLMRAFVTALLITLGLLIGLWLGTSPTTTPPAATRPTLHQVQQLADLVTLRVPVSDVQVTSIAGYTGGIELVLLVHGHAHLGTDLTQARFIERDGDRRHAVLALPMPDVRQASLDHTSTRVYRIDRTGLWRLVPGEAGEAALLNEAMERAEAVVAEAAGGAALRARARTHAERIIGQFFAELGWQVEVRWAER